MVLSGAADERGDRDTSDPDYEPLLDMSVGEYHLGDYLPTSYLEDGVRHIIVWDEDQEVRYKLVNGKVLIPESVF